jgi:hypothetical protein
VTDRFPDDGTIRFVKSRDAGAIVNATVAFSRRNAREFIGNFLLLTAPFVIASGLAMSLFFSRFEALFDPAGSPQAVQELEALFGSAFWVTMLVGFLSFAVTQAVVAAYARLYREGEQGHVSLSLLWSETWPLLLPVAAITLFALAIYLASVLFAGILGSISPLLALLWVAFWIWLAPYLHVAYASRMLETSNVFAAAARAVTLVQGAWKTAAGAVWATWFIAGALLFIINVPPSIVLAFAEVNSASGAGLGWTDAAAVPFMVLSYVAYALPAVAAFFVHGRLVADVDGADLDGELDLLAQGVDTSPRDEWGGATARDAGTAPAPSSQEAGPGRGTEEPSASSPPARGGFRGGSWGS